MANNVADVGEATEASSGVPVVNPPKRRHAGIRLDRSMRAHLRRLPDAAPEVVEEPLLETDTAPGFSALRRIAVGRGPIAGMTVDPRDGLIYVANQTDDSVAVLDPATLGIVAIIPAQEPFALAATDGRCFASTVTMSHDCLTAIDSGTFPEPAADYPLAGSVRDLCADPSGRFVYVARTGRRGADLAIVDTADGRVRTVDLRTRPGAAAQSIAVSRDGARVFVITVDDLGGELVAIDTATRRVLGGLAFPVPLRDVCVSPDGSTLYVAACDPYHGGFVDLVDVRQMRVLARAEVGGLITQIVLSAEGERIYVANGDRVSVVCTATHEIVDTVTAVAAPACIAESADGKRLYIADYDGAVTILKVASTTESLLAKMMSADVIDIPMLELEVAGAR